jgi:uncharacterized protein YbaR (Trm112 family)
VRASTFDILCCPVCKGDLILRVTKKTTLEDGEEDILEGILSCKRCDVDYPIQDGIPDLLPRNEEGCG